MIKIMAWTIELWYNDRRGRIDREERAMIHSQLEYPVTADSRVQWVVEGHPQTVIILARHGLHCAGCYISPHHTLADCAREYGVDIELLLADLNQAIDTL